MTEDQRFLCFVCESFFGLHLFCIIPNCFLIISDFKIKVGEAAGIKFASSSIIKFYGGSFGSKGIISPMFLVIPRSYCRSESIIDHQKTRK
jgi:hypothetical protein